LHVYFNSLFLLLVLSPNIHFINPPPPSSYSFSSATKELMQKIESAKQKEEAAARAEKARQNGGGSAYGEEDGCLAAYFNSGVSSFTEQPVSASLSVFRKNICVVPTHVILFSCL
jgi:hypothetical protein